MRETMRALSQLSLDWLPNKKHSAQGRSACDGVSQSGWVLSVVLMTKGYKGKRMKKLSNEDLSKMKKNEVMAEVCKGLSEVAEGLAKKVRNKDRKRVFARQAVEFSALGKAFESLAKAE
jgi:hypothetical protein